MLQRKGFISAGISAFVLLIMVTGCATVANEISVLVEDLDTVYISPRNADGVQDEFAVPVTLDMSSPSLLYGYEIRVIGSDGDETFIYREEISAPKRGVRRLFSRPSGVTPPSVLVWDGRTTEGDFAQEGEYECTLKVWDQKGFEGFFGPVRIIVDDTAPSLSLSTSFRLFSPDNDNRLDTLLINQTDSSDEDRWLGNIRSATATVKELTWEGRASDFVWDGKGTDGSVVADGTYAYSVSSTDRAGNTGEFTLQDIVVDTSAKQARLDISGRGFSPNSDGVKDTISLFPSVTNTAGLTSWEMVIVDISGQPVYTSSGDSSVPSELTFAGLNADGRPIADGVYRGIFAVKYASGALVEVGSPLFALDTVAPVATVSVDHPLFSPDGDGRRDSIAISQSTSIEETWTGRIVDSAGRQIRSLTWNNRAIQFSWNGRNTAGARVADGPYSYTLGAVDPAGNKVDVQLDGIMVDTRTVRSSATSNRTSFSPNADGFLDTLAFNLSTEPTDGIKSWTMAIAAAAGRVVKTFSGSGGAVPASLVWIGDGPSGTVADGSYTANLKIEYLKGNIGEVKSRSVVLDTTGPKLTLEVGPTPFSPDGDGTADTATIKTGASDATGINGYVIQITDPVGNPFKRYAAADSSLTPFIWNGRSDSGELVQSASDYTVSFRAVDNVGNASTTTAILPVDILVIRDGNRLKIVVSSIYFEPFTANYTKVPAEEAAQNLATLDRLAEVLKKYSEYRILTEGHAVRIYWNDPVRGPTEEAEVLAPLSLARAEVIRTALIERGVRGERISAFGIGGTRPVVPHSDTENRWKNRRVEFILVK